MKYIAVERVGSIALYDSHGECVECIQTHTVEPATETLPQRYEPIRTRKEALELVRQFLEFRHADTPGHGWALKTKSTRYAWDGLNKPGMRVWLMRHKLDELRLALATAKCKGKPTQRYTRRINRVLAVLARMQVLYGPVVEDAATVATAPIANGLTCWKCDAEQPRVPTLGLRFAPDVPYVQPLPSRSNVRTV